MSYSIWDKQPELILPKIPFEFLAGLAEKRDKQLDEVDTKLGKLKGEFASLVAAPGHEDLATGLTNDYNKKVNDWYEKYKSNPLSREGSRELASLASQFANDQRVQTVVKSRQFYEKFEPKMWEELSKRSYIDAPGILNPDGSFNQNTQSYDMSRFQLTPQADYIKSIQDQYKIKKEAKFSEQNIKPEYDAEGNLRYRTEDIQKVWNDPANRKETALAIEQMVWDNTTSDAGLIYLRKTAERQYPDDPEAQKAFVRESIRNAGVPFDFEWAEKKETIKVDDSGSSGSKDTKGKPQFGSRSTVTVDPMMDLNGNIINSKEVLDGAQVAANSNVTKAEGAIKQEFPELANVEFIATAAGKEIDFSKIKDPQQLSRARVLNAEYVSAQAHANSLEEMKHYFMELAGFKNPDQPLLDQVTLDSKIRIYDEGIEFLNKNLGVFKNLNPTKEEADLINTMAKAEALRSSSLTETQLRENYQNTLEAARQLTKSSNTRLADAVGSFYNAWKNLEENKLTEDPKYQKYTELLNNYLKSPVYREEYNYTPLSEDIGELRNAMLNARNKMDFDRRSIDDTKGSLTPEEKEAFLENEEAWTQGNITIRFDQSRNDFVVDVSHSGEIIEVHGIDGLGAYVKKIDPTMSNAYLDKQKSFFDGLNMTNGRSSSVQVYTALPDGTQQENYRLPVKSVYEAVPGIVGANDYLFKLEELNPNNVIVAKSFYDIAMFMDAYNTYKTSGLSDAQVTEKVNQLLQNPQFQIQVVDGTRGKINQKYFPTWKQTLQTIQGKK